MTLDPQDYEEEPEGYQDTDPAEHWGWDMGTGDETVYYDDDDYPFVDDDPTIDFDYEGD